MDTSNKHCAGVSSDASGNDSHAKEELTWQQQPFERKRLNMLRGPCVVCVCLAAARFCFSHLLSFPPLAFDVSDMLC